jgi:hypothetical protein
VARDDDPVAEIQLGSERQMAVPALPRAVREVAAQAREAGSGSNFENVEMAPRTPGSR